MKGLTSWLGTLFVAACVCALGLGLYDLMVRQPRTPRLALIDIAQLYAAADQSLKNRALEGVNRALEGVANAPAGVAAGTAAGTAPAAGSHGLRGADDFGPRLEAVLKDLAGECRCAIVAMATVVGADSTVPDFTPETARRMGLVLRGSAGR